MRFTKELEKQRKYVEELEQEVQVAYLNMVDSARKHSRAVKKYRQERDYLIDMKDRT